MRWEWLVRRHDLGAVLACALIAGGAYALAAGHGFVYDDVHIILNRPHLHSIANWRDILASPWWEDALYRPVTTLTFALDWTLSGGDARWFHVVNLVLHGLATLLVYVLARSFTQPIGAVAAGLIFAIHPVHVEAVANIVGRAEILSTIFVIAAVLAYRHDGALAARSDISWRRWLSSFGTLAALTLAIFSKEMAFATPGLLIIADWYDGRAGGMGFERAIQRHRVLLASSVVLTALWLWFWLDTVGGLRGGGDAPGLWGTSLAERIMVMAPVVLEYLRLFVLPVHLSADYAPDHLPVSYALTLRGAAGFLVLAALAAWAIAVRRRAPALTFALAWIGGTILIIANLLFPTGVVLAERTLYLPSVGVALVAGLACTAFARRRPITTALVVAAVVGLGLVRTVQRVPAWRNNTVFFQQLIADAPRSYRSLWAAGALRFEAGDSARGERLMRDALSVHAFDPGLWYDLGVYLQRQRRHREAAQLFLAAFRLDSVHVESAARAISNYVATGMLDSAEALEARALAIDPGHEALALARSDISLSRGRPWEALARRRQAAARAPDEWQYWFYMAITALDVRSCDDATRALARLEALRPMLPQLDTLGGRAAEVGCRTAG